MNLDNVELLKRLADAEVEMVVIGGVAAVLHGSPLLTEDLDVCSPFTAANMGRLLVAMDGLTPRFRFHPKLPPLPSDADVLATYRNLNLVTSLGKLDVLDEVPGVGTFDQVRAESMETTVEGRRISLLQIDSLIRAKERAGRVKDQLGVLHLKSVKQRLQGQKQPPQP